MSLSQLAVLGYSPSLKGSVAGTWRSLLHHVHSQEQREIKHVCLAFKYSSLLLYKRGPELDNGVSHLHAGSSNFI